MKLKWLPMHRKACLLVGFISLMACSAIHPSISAGEERLLVAEDLERLAASIHEDLQELDPAQLDRHDRSGYDLVKQLENIGPEARCAISMLTRFASQDNLVGYRVSALRSSVRALANMGDEGMPSIRVLLTRSRADTLYWTLSELNKMNYLDYSPVLPELRVIANRDRFRPSAEVIDSEKRVYKESHPDSDLESGFSVTSGSRSLDEFRELEIHSRMAIDIILGCRETRRTAVDVLVERVSRKENPSFEGLDRLVGNTEAIERLRDIALTASDADRRFAASHCLARVDPSGKVSIPVILTRLAEDRSEREVTLLREALKTVQIHPSKEKIDEATIRLAIEEAPQSERERLKQESLEESEEPEQTIRRLNNKFHELKNVDQRKARTVAGQLIRLAPNTKAVIDFLAALVMDESKPTYIQTSLGFGRPGPLNLRPLAARDLGFVGAEHRAHVLEVLRRCMNEHGSNEERRAPSDLATSSAWSIAQLDRNDADCLRCIDEISGPFSNTSIASPFYDHSGAYVAEVLGERIDVVAERLTVQALNYDFTPGAASFARQILLSAKPRKPSVGDASTHEPSAEPGNLESSRPYVAMLVKHAFEKIRGEVKQRRVREATGRQIAITFLLNLGGNELRSALDTIYDQCSSPNYESRTIAIRLLGEMQHDSEKPVAILTNACKDNRVLVRGYAARSLARLGPAAESALPHLRKLKADRYQSVRDAARTAIGAIEGAVPPRKR